MKRAAEPSRLLIVRNDRVGDLVLTLPTLEYARKAFPSSHISLLTCGRTLAMVQGNRHVDQVLIDDRRWSARQLAARLRAERFDAALVINPGTRNYLAVWLAGIPVRVTWSRRLAGWLLGNRHVTLRRSHPPIHESQFALAFARKLKADPNIQLSAPRLVPDADTVARIGARIRADVGAYGPLFAVHPGNYHSAWNWPSHRYLDLVCRLAAHGAVVVTGGPGEERLLGQLENGLPADLAHRVAFYTDFDLAELCAALSVVDVLTVSNTGPMHLAGVLGTPVVALFSAQVCQCPAKWAPLGLRNTILQAPLLPGENSRLSPEQARQHMCRIPLDEVVAANLRAVGARERPAMAYA
ncbi:MAG: glycosyltransferase family 9 protein [Thermoguttaceae bacterium]